jgi:hypothetical protein
MTLADSDFSIVHALALRKRSDFDGLVRATGAEASEIEAALRRAAEAKVVLAARGNYFVTPDGEKKLRSAYEERFAHHRASLAFGAACDRFEEVNRTVKSLVTQWQTRSVGGRMVPNDHSDEAWDERILEHLAEAHGQAEMVLADLEKEAPRFARYRERLAAALERAGAGEPEWVSGVRCDSYHSVWFELHEDLLRILDRAREER